MKQVNNYLPDYFSLPAPISIILLFILISTQEMYGQAIENLGYKVAGTKVTITYDLPGDTTRWYNVEVFSSYDGFTEALYYVNGDVGKNIIPGFGKIIVWDAKEELGRFKGNISLRVKTTYIPFIKFTNIGSKFRRGKDYDLTWTGGPEGGRVRFELYEGDTRISRLGEADNTGLWNWDISKNTKTGKYYRIRAFNDRRSEFSSLFRISPKIPWAIKALPLLAAGGVVAAILMQQPEESPPAGNEIVDPFLPE